MANGKPGAPVGNKNAEKSKRFERALLVAIDAASEQDSQVERFSALKLVASKLLEMAQQGNIAAIKEIADRLDGKSVQPTENKHEGNLTINLLQGLGRGTRRT